MGDTTVIVLTDSFRIRGNIDLAPDERVTDYITSAKNFIALTQVEVRTHENTLVFVSDFINVHRDHIVVVAPEGLTRRNPPSAR